MKKYKSQTWLDKHIAEKHGNEEYPEPELHHKKHERHKKTNPHKKAILKFILFYTLRWCYGNILTREL